MKLLALCHFLNLDLAIISSITASTMAVVFFVPWRFERKALKSRFWFAMKEDGWYYRVKVTHTSQVVDCYMRPVTKTRIWVLSTFALTPFQTSSKSFIQMNPLNCTEGLPRGPHVSNNQNFGYLVVFWYLAYTGDFYYLGLGITKIMQSNYT